MEELAKSKAVSLNSRALIQDRREARLREIFASLDSD